MVSKSILNPFTGAFDFVGEDISPLEATVANIVTLTGVPAESTDMGTFTGVTIPDNSDIKESLQALETEVETRIDSTEKGQPNGVATLDVAGKVPVAQLPNSVMELQGTWDASTNTPTLVDGTGNSGDVWYVTVAGTQNLGSGAQTWGVGDFVIYASGVWKKAPATDLVVSVNGKAGIVTLDSREIEANFTPTYYTPAQIAAEGNTKISANLNGIDSKINDINTTMMYKTVGVYGAEPSFTDNGDGTADIGGFDVTLKTNTNGMTNISKFTIAPVADLAFTDNVTSYIYVDYNAGVPAVLVTTTDSIFDNATKVPVFKCWRVGTTIHSVGFDSAGIALAEKLARMTEETMPYSRADNSGLIIAETTSPNPRTITVTGSTVYFSTYPTTVGQYTSATDLLTLATVTNGTWTYNSASLVYNNTLYNPLTGPISMDAGKYSTRWFYRSIGDVNEVFYVLGLNQYDKFYDASVEVERSDLPPVIKGHCILIGRSVIKNGDTSGDTISTLVDIYHPGQAIQHNDTSDKQGGSGTEFYHLTAAQHTIATQAATTSTSGYLTNTNYTRFDDTNTNMLNVGDSGFPIAGAGPTLTYSAVNRTLTVTGTFTFWNQGKKIVKTAVTEVTDPHPDTTGACFFYYDNAGLLTCSNQFFDLSVHTPVAYVYYNSTLVDGILFDERHGMMDWRTHLEFHVTRGAYQLGSGFALNGTYSVATGSGGLTENTFGVDTGTIVDEDIFHSPDILNDTNGVGNIYSILYRTGATNYTWIASNLPYLNNGTDIEYNQLVTGSYQRTPISANGRYINYYIFAVNTYDKASVNRFIMIPGQTLHTSLALAQAESIGNLDLAGFPIVETVPIWRITYRREGTYSDVTFNARIESVSRIVGLSSASLVTASPTNHNNLTNRSDIGGHPIQAIFGTGANEIPFQNATNTALTDSLDLTYDDVTKTFKLGTISTNTGVIALANASSSHLTKIQAGNATAAVTYTLPLADGTSGQALYTNGSAALGWKSVLAASNGDIDETSYQKIAGVDSQLISEKITDFKFNETNIRAFEALLVVNVTAGVSTYTNFKIYGIQKTTGNWTITVDSVGDGCCVNLDITSDTGFGQLVYTVDADPTRTSIQMQFRAQTLKVFYS